VAKPGREPRKLSQSQLLAVVVALLVVGLSGWIGTRARATAKSLGMTRQAWESTAAQLATVQQQFRLPTSRESAELVAEANRMSALGVPAEEKLGLVDMLGHLAEALALSAVRVSVVSVPDSAVIPARQVVGSAIKPASYAIAVEFVGRFADAQKFVSSLPPSVSLSRFSASRRDGGALYRLVLSVYEIDANSGD
jgi:hypothetical protein